MNPNNIVVTGERFAGSGFRTIGAVVRELMSQARHEVLVATYLLTSEQMVGLMEDAAARGLKVVLILNQLQEQPAAIRDRIAQLSQQYPAFRTIDFHERTGSQLHAKVMVFDRSKAIVGSANITWSGMVQNHEIGILLSGSSASMVASLFDRIF